MAWRIVLTVALLICSAALFVAAHYLKRKQRSVFATVIWVILAYYCVKMTHLTPKTLKSSLKISNLSDFYLKLRVFQQEHFSNLPKRFSRLLQRFSRLLKRFSRLFKRFSSLLQRFSREVNCSGLIIQRCSRELQASGRKAYKQGIDKNSRQDTKNAKRGAWFESARFPLYFLRVLRDLSASARTSSLLFVNASVVRG